MSAVLPVNYSTDCIARSFSTIRSCSLPHAKVRSVLVVCSNRRHSRVALTSGGVASATVTRSRRLSPGATSIMGEPQEGNGENPESFAYVQLWVSEDGESHVTECKMSGFKKQVYSSLPQFVRDNFGGQPQKLIFTELTVGLEQPLHTAPQVQFVVTLSGSWYVKTTDGTKHVFKPGDVLFQDNTDKSPAQKPGQHFSGTVGDVPCQQMIVQLDRLPEVDHTNPF